MIVAHSRYRQKITKVGEVGVGVGVGVEVSNWKAVVYFSPFFLIPGNFHYGSEVNNI
jgi:hypothetical protein